MAMTTAIRQRLPNRRRSEPAPPDPGVRPGSIRDRALRALAARPAERQQLPAPCSPNVRTVCDGAETIGYIVRRDNGFRVITANGELIGIFDSAIEAARAIPPRQRSAP
jgi:hypothetical protein